MRKLVIQAVSVFFVLPALAQAPKPSPSPTPAASPKAAVSPAPVASAKPAVSPKPLASPAPATSPKPASSPSAAKAAAARNQVAGTVVSVDEAKATITFKDAKEQTTTWKVEGKAAGRLKTLKAGDKVKIHYSVDDNGAPKAAVAIRPAGKGKKTEPS